MKNIDILSLLIFLVLCFILKAISLFLIYDSLFFHLPFTMFFTSNLFKFFSSSSFLGFSVTQCWPHTLLLHIIIKMIVDTLYYNNILQQDLAGGVFLTVTFITSTSIISSDFSTIIITNRQQKTWKSEGRAC